MQRLQLFSSPLHFQGRRESNVGGVGISENFCDFFYFFISFFPTGTDLRVSGVNICGKHLHLSSRSWRGRSPSIHLTAAVTSIGLEGKIRFANKYPAPKEEEGKIEIGSLRARVIALSRLCTQRDQETLH